MTQFTLRPIILLYFLFLLGWTSNVQAQSSKNKYSCVKQQGISRTVVDTKRGKIELIIWKSNYFGSEWPVERRCQEVTERFQKFSDTGNLRYVTTGKMNGSNVICVGDKRVSGYECRKDGLLITLQPQDSPTAVMNELFDINNRIRGGGIQRGGAIDLTSFLNKAPIIESASVDIPDQAPIPASKPSPKSPDGIEVPDIFR
jgi:hypothetical protein